MGVVGVPDPRLAVLADIVKPERMLPAAVEFVDIAGLVAGASKGEGLGNQFLAHIRETDAIAHVVRCFVNDDIVHVAGKVDPIADIDVIDTELCLADLTSVEKAVDRAAKAAKAGDKDAVRKRDLFTRLREHLNQGKPARSMQLTPEDRADLRELHLLTLKPIMYVANVNETGFTNNPYLDKVKAARDAGGRRGGGRCAPRMEAEIAQLEDAEKGEFLKDMGLAEPGLDRVIRARLPAAGPADLFHRGREGSARLDGPGGFHRAAGGGRDPHGFRAGLHPRRGDRLRGLHRLQGRGGREGSRQAAAGRQGVHRPRGRCHALPLQR